jgi:DNA-binding MarR family transcriptional regulator
MDQEILSSDKRVAFEAMVAAIRDSQSAADMMEEAYDNLLGINRTDGRCLDILQRLGPLTAGQLAREAGLTTGAVTPLLDRLEAAGYVRRRRDQADRRKVFVEITELANRMGQLVYSEMAAFGQKSSFEMPIADMRVITSFLRTSAFLDRKMSAVLAATRPPPAASRKRRLAAAETFASEIRREFKRLRGEITEVWFGRSKG